MLVEELKSRLARGDVAPLYLVLGVDPVARRGALELLTEHICPGELRAWNKHDLDAAAVGVGALVAAAGTAPFLGERRLVVIDAFDQMPATDQEAFLQAIGSRPATCWFL